MRLPVLASLVFALSACPSAPPRPVSEPTAPTLVPAVDAGAELDQLAAAPALEPLPGGAVMRLGDTGLAHAQEIRHVALSPDGQTAWSAAIYEGQPMAWDTATGRARGRVALTKDGNVEGLAISSDGATLAVAKGDSVTLVTVATGAERLVIKGEDIVAVALSPDGLRLAIGHREGRVTLVDARSGKTQKTLRGKDEMFADVAFSPDGTLVGAGGGPAAYVWDAKSGAARLKWNVEGQGYGNGIAWLSDGGLAVATSDKKVAVFAAAALAKYDAKTAPSGGFDVPGGASAIGATNDGRLVVAGFGARVSAVEPMTGAIVRDLVGGQAPGAPSYANTMTVVGRRVVTGWQSGLVRVFDLAKEAESVELAGHRARVAAVAWSSDGRFIATGGEDGTTILWRAKNGRQWRVLAPEATDGRRAKVVDVAIQPNGTLVAVATFDKHLYFWDAATGELVKRTQLTTIPSGLAWSPSGTRLGISQQSGQVVVVDVTVWKGIFDVTHGGEGALGLAFAGEDRLVTTLPNTLVIWDVTTAKVLGERKRKGLRTQMNALAVSGDSVFTGGYGGTVDRWDLKQSTEAEPASVPMHGEANGAANPVMALAAMADGFVAGGARGDVLIVGATTVQRLGHGGQVTDLVVSPDGKYAASASADMSVLVWRL